MTDLPHQIITRAIGGVSYVVTLRDPSGDGASQTVGYENRGGAQRWLSKHRFPDIERATAAALVLADFLGAEFRA